MADILAASGSRHLSEPRPAAPAYTFAPVTACDMCGADEQQFALMGLRLNRSQGLNPRRVSGIAVSVVKCRSCGLVFANPQPVPASFEAHYGSPDEYWTSDYFEPEPGYFEEEIATAKRLLNFDRGMRALDIGAGFGKAMRAMTSAGFDTYGFEPSPEFRAAAIERNNVPEDRLALAAVEDASYSPASFDFISFGAVLEHLYSPSAAIERALEWLKPGGIIQLEVPSSRWLVSRLVNAYYCLRGTSFVTNISPMHRPYHLFEFGLETFVKHGARAGYEIAEHRYLVCSIPHVPSLLRPAMRLVMDRTDSGMQLSAYLRKRQSNVAAS